MISDGTVRTVRTVSYRYSMIHGTADTSVRTVPWGNRGQEAKRVALLCALFLWLFPFSPESRVGETGLPAAARDPVRVERDHGVHLVEPQRRQLAGVEHAEERRVAGGVVEHADQHAVVLVGGVRPVRAGDKVELG